MLQPLGGLSRGRIAQFYHLRLLIGGGMTWWHTAFHQLKWGVTACHCSICSRKSVTHRPGFHRFSESSTKNSAGNQKATISKVLGPLASLFKFKKKLKPQPNRTWVNVQRIWRQVCQGYPSHRVESVKIMSIGVAETIGVSLPYR